MSGGGENFGGIKDNVSDTIHLTHFNTLNNSFLYIYL